MFPVYELATSDLPDLRDGTLEDWEEVLPGAQLDHGAFQVWGTGGQVDPGNMAIRVFLAWHRASHRIYFAQERFDDVHVRGDGSTDLFVDGDHSGGQYGFYGDQYTDEESRRRSYAQAQKYTMIPENPSGGHLLFAPYPSLATQPPWADCGGWRFGDSPSLSAVECYVTAWDDLANNDPYGSQPSDLKPGQFIGFQIVTNDSDTEGRIDVVYTLAQPTEYVRELNGDRVIYHSLFAQNFVDGVLIPCSHDDCSGAATAVPPNSWGRIKAGLAD